MPSLHGLLLICLLPTAIAAQRVPTGSVTGHVTYAGTNLPVRNAHVVLEPVPQLNAPKPDADGSLGAEGNHTIVETLPDGSFRFPAVKPGSYYVLADKLGCLSPISVLTRSDLEHPTEQGLARMAQLLSGVTVAANKTADISIQVHPGAAIAGTVRFDDGSPDTGARVQLMTRNPAGKWAPFRTTAMGSFNGSIRTDDRGQYRISGLPAGEYLIFTPLEIVETQANFVFSGGGSSSTRTVYSLDIYQDQTFRPADARPVKLADTEDSAGNNLEVPVAKMHLLTGSLAEQRTGHAVNAGKVALLFPDSDDVLASTEVTPEDGQFHFDFVPEGTYTLKITSARDVTRQVIPYPKGTMPPTHTEEKTIKTYADATQLIILNGNQIGVIVPISPLPDPK